MHQGIFKQFRECLQMENKRTLFFEKGTQDPPPIKISTFLVLKAFKNLPCF